MKHKAILLHVMLIMCISAMSTEEWIQSCSQTKSDESRLGCYDMVAESISAQEETDKTVKKISSKKNVQSTDTGTGNWRLAKTKSKIDDTESIAIYVTGIKEEEVMFGERHPSLYIRCQNNTTEMFIAWGGQYINTRRSKVRIRADKEKPRSDKWGVSTDGTATFSIMATIKKIKYLFGHKELVSEVTDFRGSTTLATFDILGIENAIQPIRKACRW